MNFSKLAISIIALQSATVFASEKTVDLDFKAGRSWAKSDNGQAFQSDKIMIEGLLKANENLSLGLFTTAQNVRDLHSYEERLRVYRLGVSAKAQANMGKFSPYISARYAFLSRYQYKVQGLPLIQGRSNGYEVAVGGKYAVSPKYALTAEYQVGDFKYKADRNATGESKIREHGFMVGLQASI